MSWLDAILDRTKDASPPASVPKPRAEPKPEVKLVWFQVRPARADDFGIVEAAYYSVADGVLTMHDEQGKPTGKTYRLGKEDPRDIAKRLGRAAWSNAAGPMSDFDRPLHYEPLGIA